MITDKRCVQQIFGSLLKHPQYLSEVDKYNLSVADFSTRFEKFIFTAIYNLYQGGAQKVSSFDVENYLSTNSSGTLVFQQNNGVEYLQDVEEFSNQENFPYYYNRLKKINLLNSLHNSGIDISDYYIENEFDPRAHDVNAHFEELTIADIVNGIKKKLTTVEREYSTSEEVQNWNAADEIDEVFNSIGDVTSIGLPIQGTIYSRVIGGAERGALTIRSAPSGSYKTRTAVGDACYLAYPIRFDLEVEKWVCQGSCEPVLFIITEQKKEQLLKMILAYLSGVNESKFKYGTLTNEEAQRVNIAKAIMKTYRENFQILRIPNPTIDLIKVMIRENVLLHDIQYVFFDYIFIGPALLDEFRGFSLRNDELLLMFATALKDLAIELNVSVFTSTQVNANVDNNKNIRNEASLAGGRSTINKADNGAIMARPTKEELEVLSKVDPRTPNLVTDVFKVRSGAWSQVRIWSIFDGGTLRREDLYITDNKLDIIEDFYNEPFAEVIDWTDERVHEIKKVLDKCNTGEILNG